MNTPGSVVAVLADDEPLLLQSLKAELKKVWPALQVAATAANGEQALAAILDHQPQVAFLDIRMPGASGIEVAQAVAEDWPDNAAPPPLIVFVTAHDEYAIAAFQAAAADYLLKPVTAARLRQTTARLQERLAQAPDIHQLGDQIRQLLAGRAAPAKDSSPLRMIRASVGDTVHMIPVDEVVLFESADKYVIVHTAGQEALIREPLRNLITQLDPDRFSQVHRGAIVNMHRVEAAVRDESGKLRLRLTGLDTQPVVSRMYRHLFQAM